MVNGKHPASQVLELARFDHVRSDFERYLECTIVRIQRNPSSTKDKPVHTCQFCDWERWAMCAGCVGAIFKKDQ